MNLDFLWTWAVVPNRQSFLHKSLYSQHALVCSVLAIQKHYPEARKRFLVDQKTYDLLESKNLIRLWDSVEIVEFPQDSPAFKSYYAFPKIYTYRFIENPTFILDAECIFKQRVEIWDTGTVQGPSWTLQEGEREKIHKWLSRWPNYKQDYYPIEGNQYISAAHLFIPNPEVGKYVSYRTQKHLEDLFSKVKIEFGGWTACYVEDGYITHCFEDCCNIDFRPEFWGAVHHEIDEKWQSLRENGAFYFENLEKEVGLEGAYDRYLKKTRTNLL